MITRNIYGLIIPFTHLTFLIFLIDSEGIHWPILMLLLWVFIGLLLLFGMSVLFPRQAQLKRNYADIIMLVIGAFTTYFLSIDVDLGPVVAAGVTGFLASFLPSIGGKTEDLRLFSFSLYCGAFVGMSGSFVLNSYSQLGLAAIMAGIVYVICTNTLNGIGGKHGTIAFIGVLLVKAVFSCF